MLLDQLELTDVRSYASADLRFGPAANVLVSRQARGKNTVPEAISCQLVT